MHETSFFFTGLVMIVLTLVSAILGIAFNYKSEKENNNFNGEKKQNLSLAGIVAIIVAILASLVGCFSIYKENEKLIGEQRIADSLQTKLDSFQRSTTSGLHIITTDVQTSLVQLEGVTQRLNESAIKSSRIINQIDSSVQMQDIMLQSQEGIVLSQMSLFENFKRNQYPLQNLMINGIFSIKINGYLVSRLLELSVKDYQLGKLSGRYNNPLQVGFTIDSLGLTYFIADTLSAQISSILVKINNRVEQRAALENYGILNFRLRFLEHAAAYEYSFHGKYFDLVGLSNDFEIRINRLEYLENKQENYLATVYFDSVSLSIGENKYYRELSLFDLQEKYFNLELINPPYVGALTKFEQLEIYSTRSNFKPIKFYNDQLIDTSYSSRAMIYGKSYAMGSIGKEEIIKEDSLILTPTFKE